jgi:nicotinamide-nucleotide amidase
MGSGLSDRAAHVARAALDSSYTVAVAESLTSGAMASALGAAPKASEWFRGAVVAYSTDVKHGLLGVPQGPVVSESAVSAMARQTAHLLGADVTLAVSGVGGPDPQDGQPVGTVWFAVHSQGTTRTERRGFDGAPEAVVDQTVDHGLHLLLQAISPTRRNDEQTS